MEFVIREMTIADYDAVFALWLTTEGVGLSGADSYDGIACFLERNPGLSYVAYAVDETLAGAVLCGHDGRRGYLHHLAVAEFARWRGLGRELVGCCLESLAQIGIEKCHLFVFSENAVAQQFWRSLDWTPRAELVIMSHAVPAAIRE